MAETGSLSVGQISSPFSSKEQTSCRSSPVMVVLTPVPQ